VSADHTERLFVALGLPLRRIGSVVAFDPTGWDRRLPPLGEIALPGSATIAAYLAAVAQTIAGSDVTLRGVGLNPGRSGLLDLLRMWGGAIAIEPHGDAALREPIGDVRIAPAAISGGRLRGGVVDGELLVRARDEVAALALLGAFSQRGAQLYDLAWLGADSDPQWLALDPVLRAFGANLERSEGAWRIARAADETLRPARVDSGADPRVSLAACALALATPGLSVVEHAAQALRAVHPGFVETARALGADIDFV
jgi:3-phosphoshikimate 1-carboxyvinyltransferase